MFNPREQCVSNVCFKIKFGKSVTGLGLAASKLQQGCNDVGDSKLIAAKTTQ
jgi:hypothetical protein